MCQYLLYVVVIILIQNNVTTSAKLQTHSELKDRDEVIECVTKVLKQINIKEQRFNYLTLTNVDNALAESLHRTRHTFISRSFFWITDFVYNSVYLIMVHDIDELKEGLKLAKRDTFWNPRAYFIIIIAEVDDIYFVSDILNVYNIFNVIVIFKEKVDLVIYSLDASTDTCNRFHTKMLQLYLPCSNYSNNNTFGFKPLERLQNCNIKFVSHHYWPFINLKDESKVGIEDIVLRMWRQIDNVTVELVDYGAMEDFGGVMENGTYYGMLKLIYTRAVEGAIGGYVVDYKRSRSFDYTYPYVIDHQRVVIHGARVLSIWDAMLCRFSTPSLVILCALFLIFSIIVTCFSKEKLDIPKNVLIVLGYFTNNIQRSKTDTKHGFRFVVVHLLLSTFFVSNVFQAHLSSAKTDPPRQEQVDDLSVVTKTYGPHLYNNWKISFDLPDYKPCQTKLQCLKRIKESDVDKPAYTVLNDDEYNFLIWKITDDDFRLPLFRLHERVGTLPRTVMFDRGSPIKESLDILIQKMAVAGLFEKQTNDIIYDEKLKALYKLKRQNYVYKPFTMRDMRQPFILLIIGSCTSFITFICEIIFCKKNKKRLN